MLISIQILLIRRMNATLYLCNVWILIVRQYHVVMWCNVIGTIILNISLTNVFEWRLIQLITLCWVYWLPVKITPQSKVRICFLSEHNGVQQPQSYVNKRGHGIPPKFTAHYFVIQKEKNVFIHTTDIIKNGRKIWIDCIEVMKKQPYPIDPYSTGALRQTVNLSSIYTLPFSSVCWDWLQPPTTLKRISISIIKQEFNQLNHRARTQGIQLPNPKCFFWVMFAPICLVCWGWNRAMMYINSTTSALRSHWSTIKHV